MRRTALTVALLALAGPAQAWKHTGEAWLDEDLPVSYFTDDDGFDECLPGIAGGLCADATAAAYDGWAVGECTAFGGVDQGTFSSGGFVEDYGDGINGVAFGGVEEIDPGVLAFTANVSYGIAFVLDGQSYTRIHESDIHVNTAVDWGTAEEIAAGNCATEEYNLQAVLAHEVGHQAGLDHSCDEGETCTDPDLLGAVMYWASPPCETTVEPQADDLAGIDALYGPYPRISCGDGASDPILTTAPATLNCVVTADGPIDQASWRFGDGETDEGTAVTHTWEEEGLYTLTVEASGEDGTCGAWEGETERLGYVRVCDEPRADFHIEHILGTRYDVRNDTPIDVVGCVTDVRWAIYEGDRITEQPYEVFENWEFTYEFPEEGTWTVVLNVSGPAGTTASRITTDIVSYSGLNAFECGCDGGSRSASPAWLLLALVGLRRRR